MASSNQPGQQQHAGTVAQDLSHNVERESEERQRSSSSKVEWSQDELSASSPPFGPNNKTSRTSLPFSTSTATTNSARFSPPDATGREEANSPISSMATTALKPIVSDAVASGSTASAASQQQPKSVTDSPPQQQRPPLNTFSSSSTAVPLAFKSPRARHALHSSNLDDSDGSSERQHGDHDDLNEGEAAADHSIVEIDRSLGGRQKIPSLPDQSRAAAASRYVRKGSPLGKGFAARARNVRELEQGDEVDMDESEQMEEDEVNDMLSEAGGSRNVSGASMSSGRRQARNSLVESESSCSDKGMLAGQD